MCLESPTGVTRYCNSADGEGFPHWWGRVGIPLESISQDLQTFPTCGKVFNNVCCIVRLTACRWLCKHPLTKLARAYEDSSLLTRTRRIHKPNGTRGFC